MNIKKIILEAITENNKSPILNIRNTKTEDLIPYSYKHSDLDLLRIDSPTPREYSLTIDLNRGDWDEWKEKHLKHYGDGFIQYNPRFNKFEVIKNPKYQEDKEEVDKAVTGFYDRGKNYKHD